MSDHHRNGKEKNAAAVSYSNAEHKKRLRERFMRSSLEGFSCEEILEFILSYGAPNRDLKQLSKALLQRFTGLRGVLDAGAEDLRSIPGLGENAVVLLKLLKDLAGVYLKERIMGQDVIRDKREMIDYLNLTLSGERVEKFIAVYLNAKGEVLAIETLHEGTINQTAVYPRKAIEKAFRHNAHSIIFVHNHPSGDASPSQADMQLTRILDRAALAVDLYVYDHLVIGKDSHFSARENGWIIGAPARTAFAADIQR